MVRKQSLYEQYGKRCLDIVLSITAIIGLSWLLLIIALLVRIKLGGPVIFCQIRPGKDEKLFRMFKFRTMTDERDENGNFLPDEVRLTSFGKKLRSTSLDELPELFCILKGDMSIIGPRPQLIRDMVFMSNKQRERHNIRPGLSGLAQVSGRNAITWDMKLKYDIDYLESISFKRDIQLIIKTILAAFIKKEGITEYGMATAMDYGDWLLKKGKITKDEYEEKQLIAKRLLQNYK